MSQMEKPIMTRRGLLCLLGLAATSALAGQSDSVSRSWNRPVKPFRIIDSIYYVGASDVTSFLIATSEGLILIDGGFAETAPQILANVRALGYDPGGIRILLNSHAHYDHAGGLAELKRVTGARAYAGRGDSALLARGGRDDFFFRNRFPFPPIGIDQGVMDGDRVELGQTTITALATPGHTRGCTTWRTEVMVGGRQLSVLFVCSLSIPGYSFGRDAPYPGIAQDYEASIAKLRRVPCDVFLAPHGAQFDLVAKMTRAVGRGARSSYIDPKGCRRYLEGAADAVVAELRKARARAIP
jgi:metallo-beta-lactamase class B